MQANGPADSQDSLERWTAAEHRLMERCRKLGWWEAARMAAGYERVLPDLSLRGLQAWTVQTAASADKLDHLEVAHRRLRKAIRRDLWSSADGPPDGMDDQSVEEVEEAVIGLACNALTAVVLCEEIERGVISGRRREQLEGSSDLIVPDGLF